MKRATILGAAALMTFTFSSPVAAAGTAEECQGVDQLVSIFIQHRQEGGWTLQTMMEKFGTSSGFREIILDAYSVPRMTTPAARQAAIEEFQNRWLIRCYQEGPPDLTEDLG